MICVSGVARLGKVVSPGNLEFGNPGIAGKTGIYSTEYDTQYTVHSTSSLVRTRSPRIRPHLTSPVVADAAAATAAMQTQCRFILLLKVSLARLGHSPDAVSFFSFLLYYVSLKGLAYIRNTLNSD